MKRIICTAVLAAIALTGLATGSLADDRTVEFEGRQINLKPYFEGFPYNGFRPFYAAAKMYYYHEGETRTLRELNLGGKVDLAKGKVVSDVDFSTRNVWSMRYNPRDKMLYWAGDEKNDEIINLYRLSLKSKKIEKLTEVPYIFGWRWDRDKKRVAYVARLGDKEERLGQLRIKDLEKGIERVVLDDTEDMRFTWTSPSWQPYGQGVVVTMLQNADRNQGNLAYISFETGTHKILTDTAKERNWPSAYKDWLDGDSFVYTSNEGGFENAYRYNIRTGENQQITEFTRDIGSSEMIDFNGRKYLFAVLENPIENTIVVVDPLDGKILVEKKVDVNVSILDDDNNKLMLYCTSATEKFRIDEVTVDPRGKKGGLKFKTKVETPSDLKAKIVHAKVQRIEYPTFDTDPKTGEARKLHAFLYTPENPQPKDKALVMIQSFYGGGNYFSTRNQILAEAGIYVLSPSPRGSSGFGREFSALNDKDLGGNEIIDIIYAGKYVSELLGIPPERIGVFGGSHGGYATMRLLTFPGEINGNKADFDWGFGMSHAGFSDIIQFYEFCNIPDWVTMEAGDPATEADKLRDRSPLYHADKARGKLLLTHGTNDSRVPIEGSRAMADSLRKYGKDVTLIEFEGQGHGIKGLDRQIKFYTTWFEFLEMVAASGGQARR